MPFEHQTKFTMVFRQQFEYWTSEYWTTKSPLFRCFCFSDFIIQIQSAPVVRLLRIFSLPLNLFGYIFYYTLGHEKLCRHRTLHFSQSTRLHFSSQSLVDTVDARQRPFYSPFHHALKIVAA